MSRHSQQVETFTLPDPYEGENGQTLHDLHIHIGQEDVMLIKRMWPKHGALRLVAANLIHAFCQEVREQARKRPAERESFGQVLERRRK